MAPPADPDASFTIASRILYGSDFRVLSFARAANDGIGESEGILPLMPGVFLSYARADGETAAAMLRDRLAREAPDISIKQDRLVLEGGLNLRRLGYSLITRWQASRLFASVPVREFLLIFHSHPSDSEPNQPGRQIPHDWHLH
jgi:hypothetical protein